VAEEILKMKRCPRCRGQIFRATAEKVMDVEVFYDGDGRVRKVGVCEDDAPGTWELTNIICEGTYHLRPDGSKPQECDMEFKSWDEIPDVEN